VDRPPGAQRLPAAVRAGLGAQREAWAPDNRLVGGLYGVAIGGFFAGESMFHHERDASKVALVALVEAMRAGQASLLDVQWVTPHLASMGRWRSVGRATTRR